MLSNETIMYYFFFLIRLLQTRVRLFGEGKIVMVHLPTIIWAAYRMMGNEDAQLAHLAF